jgi:hypothetical protein
MVKISDIELPLIFKNMLLFKAGEWNHLTFSKEAVDKSVKNTKWSPLSKRLYTYHDNATKFGDWNGNVENVRSVDGSVYGDVEIWDADKAMKLQHGKSPFAISADMEYKEDSRGNIDTIIFTGFALEYDPGVRDVNMYLSDSVKNEMNGMFHARFSNIVENPETLVKEAEEVKEEPKEEINTQSTERRLEKQNAKMENENKPSEPEAKPEAPKEEPQVNPLETKVQQLEAQLAEMSKPKEAPVEQPKEVPQEQPKEEPKANVVESTPVNPTPNIISMDENAMATMVEKITEKLKPVSPVTVNEFGGEPQDPEEATIDRLAESLAK